MRLELIPGGHVVHIDAAEKFYASVLSFLDTRVIRIAEQQGQV